MKTKIVDSIKEVDLSDLISRSALIEALKNHYINLTNENVPKSIPDFYCEMEKLIKEQPQVKATPIVPGEWIKT